ncbi:anti-sigma factor RsbA family regulatory protein [Streptomyces sp. SID3343]|uniref:anti-sigma factor RsbA family regulatory protein n=1 Tax=Streptomyces sp. SID3343 TaxID=2690260 RepID=UPI00136DCB50|nr:anti-sigma factor RsbA family regulatory protein [Streptomyces sp. SID3343]MYW04853.1 sensor histidine kinase [Streptomyces sp. SID3343]
MSTTTTFRHEALLYAGITDFVDHTAAFVREGLAADEAVAVAVIEPRAGALRDSLGADAAHVTWIDMERVGRNPARIIPTWQEWTGLHRDRAYRGIGEPIWAARTPAELVECGHHESLLNLAFDGQPWQLLCPYDISALDTDVIAAARRNHPRVLNGGTGHAGNHLHPDDYAATLHGPALPPVPEHAQRLAFRSGELASVRALVRRALPDAPRAQVNHAILAVSEIAGNSIVHGGGQGAVTIWSQGPSLICEIQDSGCIVDPLAGRHRPTTEQDGGRGLWMANQLCDLVQIRSTDSGTTVRLHLSAGA